MKCRCPFLPVPPECVSQIPVLGHFLSYLEVSVVVTPLLPSANVASTKPAAKRHLVVPNTYIRFQVHHRQKRCGSPFPLRSVVLSSSSSVEIHRHYDPSLPVVQPVIEGSTLWFQTSSQQLSTGYYILFSSLSSFSLPNHCESLLTFSLWAVFLSHIHPLCYLLVQASPCPIVGSPSRGHPLVPSVYFITFHFVLLCGNKCTFCFLAHVPCPLKIQIK